MRITRKGYYTITLDGVLLTKNDKTLQVTSRDEAYERITEDGRGGLFTIHSPDRTVDVPLISIPGVVNGTSPVVAAVNVPSIYLPDDLLFIHWSVPVRAYPEIQLDYKLTGYDWHNRVLAWSLTVAPTGMTISSMGVISWVPTSQDGTHNITVRMKPGSGAHVERSWVCDVDADNFLFFATTGNDSTGDGAIGTPYLTLHKCLTEINTGESFTAMGRGGSHTEVFDDYNSNGSPLSNETFTELTQVLITSYPGEQVLFTGTSGPLMNNGEIYVVFDKINHDGVTNTKGAYIVPTKNIMKRCRVINSDWVNSENCTGFTIYAGGILDYCTAQDNYDRGDTTTHHNSSNFLSYNDKPTGGGDAYIIDCIDDGGSITGFKEKHSGTEGHTYYHRCIMRGG